MTLAITDATSAQPLSKVLENTEGNEKVALGGNTGMLDDYVVGTNVGVDWLFGFFQIGAFFDTMESSLSPESLLVDNPADKTELERRLDERLTKELRQDLHIEIPA